MKVYIGNYINTNFSFYRVAEKIFFWAKTKDEFGFNVPDKWVDYIGDFLTYGKPKLAVNNFNEDKTTWLYNFANSFVRKRKIKVKIHKYDTWSADSTLAYIIAPVLKQYKASTHGHPNVSDKDVPKELRSTSAPPVSEYETDALAEKRWDWVLDEMIFAFESVNNPEQEDSFWVNDKFDKKAHADYYKRIRNGFILFGKYYLDLWD